MHDDAVLVHAMAEALAEADAAGTHGDVPIGAVVIGADGVVIGRGHNRREADADPTAHAEVEALRAAAKARGTWRLDDCTLVVTLEPCPMCAGAAWAARVGAVVFGAADAKAGALGSLYHLGSDPRLNHEFPVRGGVEADACAARLHAFFDQRRSGPPPTGGSEGPDQPTEE